MKKKFRIKTRKTDLLSKQYIQTVEEIARGISPSCFFRNVIRPDIYGDPSQEVQEFIVGVLTRYGIEKMSPYMVLEAINDIYSGVAFYISQHIGNFITTRQEAKQLYSQFLKEFGNDFLEEYEDVSEIGEENMEKIIVFFVDRGYCPNPENLAILANEKFQKLKDDIIDSLLRAGMLRAARNKLMA